MAEKNIKFISEKHKAFYMDTNKDGVKVYTTDVVVEEQEFAESKKSQGYGMNEEGPAGDGFMNVPDGIDEELPFS